MKNMRVGAALLLILCCDVCLAGDYDPDQLVQALMQRSGLRKQIDQIPQVLQAELDLQQGKATGITQEEYSRISSMAKSAFNAKTIHASVQAYIRSNLSEKDMRAALEWLDSPLGKKITKLEEDASTPEGHADMQAIGPRLLDENRDTARMTRITRLDKATGATRSTVMTVLNVELAMITAMSAAMEEDRRPSFEDVRDLVRMNQPQIEAAMSRVVQMHFLYTYRVLTDHEIDQYTRFAESESGKRYHEVTIMAIDEALVQAARKLGSRIGMRMNTV